MTVLMPNVTVIVESKQHAFDRDEHGMPVAPAAGVPPVATGPFAGAVKERPEQGTWKVRLNVAHWPVERGDVVIEQGGAGRRWVVTDAQLHVVPGASDVDHIAVRAQLDPPKVP